MTAIPLTEDQLREAVRAVKLYGSTAAAARELNISRTTLQSRYYRAIAAGYDDAIVHPVPAGHRVKGVSTLYDKDQNVKGQWVKTAIDARPTLEQLIDTVTLAFEEFSPRSAAQIQDPYIGSPDLATIYPLADWHIGLLAWDKETGEDWDLNIAKAIIEKTVSRLFSITPQTEQAVILGLGDLLHSDGYDNQTSKSKNQLDVDGRWPKLLRMATELVIYVVEGALTKHNKVLIRILPGNHDEESAIAVTLALSVFYSNNPRVQVDIDPSRFWWWRWGATFLGATHGDKAKMADLPLLMAQRKPQDWAASKFRHIYTGHIHTDTALEKAGVKVESFQTPVAPDAWHHSMGYGAGRSMQAIILHKELGEISRLRSNIITE